MIGTLYLRRERTTDRQTLAQPAALSPAQRDVVAYLEPEALEPVARWPWFYDSKPDKRNRYVTLNCYRRRAVWLPDGEALA